MRTDRQQRLSHHVRCSSLPEITFRFVRCWEMSVNELKMSKFDKMFYGRPFSRRSSNHPQTWTASLYILHGSIVNSLFHMDPQFSLTFRWISSKSLNMKNTQFSCIFYIFFLRFPSLITFFVFSPFSTKLCLFLLKICHSFFQIGAF